MKKKGIIIFIIVVAFFTNVLLFLFNPHQKDYVHDEFYSNWMSTLNDNAQINSIVIPGSHDAGSYTMIAQAQTQGHSILSQLNAGVRYFDLRVNKSFGQLVIFHSVINGMPFDDVIDDIKTFTTANPTELLILDFQHFKGNVEDEVEKILEKELNVNTKAVKNTADLSTLTIGDIRDTQDNITTPYIITWGSSNRDKSYQFKRNGDSGVGDGNLSSPYVSTLHKVDADEFISDTIPKYLSEKTTQDLFVLQCQLTPKIMAFKPYTSEGKLTEKMDKFINSLKTSSDLDKINIIMRDYIASGTNKIDLILQLNLTKNLVNVNNIAEFTQKTTIKT